MSARTRATALVAATAFLLAGCGGPKLTSVFGCPAQDLRPLHCRVVGVGSLDHQATTLGPDCLGVLGAYSAIALGRLPSPAVPTGPTGDPDQLTQHISVLGGTVPDQLRADFEALRAARNTSDGRRSPRPLSGSPAVSAAVDDNTRWTAANCG